MSVHSIVSARKHTRAPDHPAKRKKAAANRTHLWEQLQLQKRRGLWKATSVLGRATAQWPVSLEVAVDGHIGTSPPPVKRERATFLTHLADRLTRLVNRDSARFLIRRVG